MLAIRMQRTGRKGHAMFRVVVQDARRTPTSGNVVASLGSYDPHLKVVILDKEKAAFYLDHGAQPSDRSARLLQSEGVKLPDWVKLSANKERTVRNADKRRSTQPPAPVEEKVEAVEPEAPIAEVTEAPVETETANEPVAEETESTETEKPEANEEKADSEKTEETPPAEEADKA